MNNSDLLEMTYEQLVIELKLLRHSTNRDIKNIIKSIKIVELINSMVNGERR